MNPFFLFSAATLSVKQQQMLDSLKKANAFSEQTAVTLEEIGFNQQNPFDLLSSNFLKSIVAQTEDGKYYLIQK